jgi:hypothetical protein
MMTKFHAFRWKDFEENVTYLMYEILMVCTYRALGFIYTNLSVYSHRSIFKC